MLHRIVLVLTLLVAVGCTGDDTIIREVEIFCPTLERVLMEDETCPDPPPVVTTPSTTPTTPDPDTDRGATGRADCNIQVERASTEEDPFEGTTGDDNICGNERDDVIDGRKGDDTIQGGAGDDILIGSDDRDVLKGEAGDDVLVGGEDDDVLDGGADIDTVDYNREYTANTGTGVAVEVDLSDEHAVDTYGDEDELVDIENVKGTPVNDMITGDGEANKLEGLAGDDTIKGGGGNDIIDGGGEAGDDLDGGAGTDTIILRGATEDSFSLAAEDDNAENFENITSMLTTAAVGLTGDSGPNTIIGGVGVDTMIGGAGRDTLNGGEGNDVINNGPGVNTLRGGKGADNFMIDALDANADTIEDFTITDDTAEQDIITCVLTGNDDIAAFLAISKKELTTDLEGERARGEITAVTVEVRVTDNKRELAIYEIYTQVTVAANPGADPVINEERMEQTPRKLRTLVRLSGLSSDDTLEFARANDCSQDKS